MKLYTHLMLAVIACSSIHAMELNTPNPSAIHYQKVTKDNFAAISQKFPTLETLMADEYFPYFRKLGSFRGCKDVEIRHHLMYKVFQIEVEDLYKPHPTQMYIAQDNATLVGMVSFDVDEQDRRNVFLRNVIVATNYKLKGNGKKLALLPFTYHPNVTTLKIQCPRMYDDGIKFFKKIGFMENNSLSILELLHPDDYVGLVYTK